MRGAKPPLPYVFINRISVQRRDNFTFPHHGLASWSSFMFRQRLWPLWCALMSAFSVLWGVDVDLSFSFGFFRRILRLLIAGLSKESLSS